MEEFVNFKKTKTTSCTPKQLQEQYDRERRRVEEKETLKLLEKLESQVVKKKKLPSLNNTEKRLMDSLTSMRKEVTKDGLEKGASNMVHKKASKCEKIEIIVDDGVEEPKRLDDDQLDSEFIKICSKDKMAFFFTRVREVYDFLMSIKLFRYIEVFIEDGFEDLESILEIDQGYFKEREFQDEHRQRILHRVAELRGEKELVHDGHVAVTEFATDTNFDNLLPLGIDKECCWNCLKVIVKENAVSYYFEEKVIKLKVVN
jgi:hypothetical protein